jgi:hypothetical protein
MSIYKFRDDQRHDDEVVTPRGIEGRSKSVSAFPNQKNNPDSNFEF